MLGLGVSHLPLVSGRGHQYGKPLSAMRAYLDAMDATPYDAPVPGPVPRVLAALRPNMLELAATRTQGAHPYFVTPEHTRRARQTLGPDPLLAPEQARGRRHRPGAGREPPPAGTRRPTSPCPTT